VPWDHSKKVVFVFVLFVICCCTHKDVFLVLHNRSYKVWLFVDNCTNKLVSAQ